MHRARFYEICGIGEDFTTVDEPDGSKGNSCVEVVRLRYWLTDGTFSEINGSSGVLDVLLHPRLPPLVRPLPPLENVSLFRVEESEVEQELRDMLGLASAEGPEPVVSAHEPVQEFLGEPQNPVEPAGPPPHSMLHPAPQTPNPRNSPAQPTNDTQVEDQPNTTHVVTLSQDKVPTEDSPPANSTPATTKFGEGLPSASEPPQPPSWEPISFVGDEEEEEEEIPSINMDSDSD